MTAPPQPRVLMTTDPVGGVWTYSTTLARALTARGYRVTLVTLGPLPKAEQLADLADIDNLDVEITDLALEWMDPEGHDMPRAREELRHIVGRVAPDLVHLNGFREALYQFGVPMIVVTHSCVGSWWQACRGAEPMEAKWTPYLRHVADGLNAAEAWVAATRTYAAWLQGYYKPRTQAEVILNGVPPIEAPGPKEDFILAAGRLWDEAKNLTALADIAPDLPWPVRVAGATQAENGGSISFDNVEQLGPLPHRRLLSEMSRASLFVSPALYEPFGLCVLEAAASRCALVLADIPTFRELWNGAALFADPRDASALTHAIRTLCDEPALRAELQSRARARSARYSLDKTVDRYCALYARLISSAERTHAPASVEPCA
jgi:glycosyltransferase involved in cell wall biosynthesis